jgi:enoyl-CoA hydratase
MAEFETILYEKEGKVAWITLNRPKVLNAQNLKLRGEMIQVLQTAKDDDSVQAIVITGAGDRAFSAGFDINEFISLGSSGWFKIMKGSMSQEDLIRGMPKPVIAAVNGLCLGSGCETAMACDIIIASENASFGQPEVNVGTIPGGGGTQLFPRLIGEKKAKELIFTGHFMSAEEALRYGLVNKVVPLDKLKETVDSLLKEILRQSPIILGIAKLAVNKSLETTLSTGLSCEQDLFTTCFGTEDQKEGAKAFLEKRKPVYKGK